MIYCIFSLIDGQPQLKYSLRHIFFASILSWSLFRSNRLKADLSGVFSLFPMQSLLSTFGTLLLVPCLDELVNDITAISTRGITTLSIAVKIASCMRLSTISTALSTAFLILSSILFLVIWFWHALISPSTVLSGLL